MYRLIPSIVLVAIAADGFAAVTLDTSQHRVNIETVVDDLEHPWGLAFLPNGDMLVTERHGKLRMIQGGVLLPDPIGGLPDISEHGQGGLLGIALHPKFQENRYVYLAFAAKGRGGRSTEVIRGRFNGASLEDVETIFVAAPKSRGGRHFGGRLAFDREGHLFISLGDRGEQDQAQDRSDHRGTLVRLNDDGSGPADNPFANDDRYRPEIYTYGNRNMQGMAVHPETGAIWTHEHGPQGGDEVNIMRAGVNYGWPVITYGVNYGIGTKIGEGTAKPGMAQPLHKWVPSIAPSGMAFYSGAEFPNWRGDLFVGSLKFGELVRLELDGERVVDEERMFDGEFGRIRDVVSGPDGLLYILTDERNGKLLRLSPAD